MTNFNNLSATIRSLYEEYDEKWSGYLYRSSEKGIYYHTNQDGAKFYGKTDKFECPDDVNGVLIDLDEDYAEIIEKTGESEDVGLAVEKFLPILRRSLHFDCVVINGETGRDVTGIPVEVVLFDEPKSMIDKIAGEMK